MKRRIFLAISLPEDIREKVIEAVKRWQWLPIRWLPPQNWHVTVIPPFYADDQELKLVIEVLKDTARRLRPFNLSFKTIILAPPGKKARMIWLSGKTSPGLKTLKEFLEAKVAESKIIPAFAKEDRAPIPHLTLARFEEGDLRELEEKTKTLEELPLSFEVRELSIMESRLKLTGAEYQTLEKILLGSEEKNRPPYEFLPHTADLRIRVRGRTLEELFQNSILGMAEYIKKGLSSIGAKTSRPVELSAPDTAALLIDFLSSALTLADTNQEVYPAVRFDEFSERHLKGTFSGVPVSEFDKDIKAVTYHGAEIKKIDGGYEVTIIFDI